jgi:hypothetical protein
MTKEQAREKRQQLRQQGEAELAEFKKGLTEDQRAKLEETLKARRKRTDRARKPGARGEKKKRKGEDRKAQGRQKRERQKKARQDFPALEGPEGP